MPFVSQAQVKKCFALNDPRWNCRKYAKGWKKLPKHRIKVGPRGGRYYVRNGRKVYITSSTA